jgi:hypothetical protein
MFGRNRFQPSQTDEEKALRETLEVARRNLKLAKEALAFIESVRENALNRITALEGVIKRLEEVLPTKQSS